MRSMVVVDHSNGSRCIPVTVAADGWFLLMKCTIGRSFFIPRSYTIIGVPPKKVGHLSLSEYTPVRGRDFVQDKVPHPLPILPHPWHKTVHPTPQNRS